MVSTLILDVKQNYFYLISLECSQPKQQQTEKMLIVTYDTVHEGERAAKI